MTRMTPPKGVMSSQTRLMNSPEPAVTKASPSVGQHSAEQGASSTGVTVATSSTPDESLVVVSLLAQHDEAQAVFSLASTTLVEFFAKFASVVVLEQQVAAQAVSSFGVTRATSSTLAESSVVVEQHAAAQGVVPSGSVDTAAVVSLQGVGQQSSGPANAANEIKPSPTNPIRVGAKR